MKDEKDHKEQQRQNFNNMIETARAEAALNPPAPHDPMRFRAVPPGTLLARTHTPCQPQWLAFPSSAQKRCKIAGNKAFCLV